SSIFAKTMSGASRSVPTAVYVALTYDEDWSAAKDIAQKLRGRGISTEVATKADKFGKQIRHADRRGIPYIWFTSYVHTGKTVYEIKDIRSGNQTQVDLETW